MDTTAFPEKFDIVLRSHSIKSYCIMGTKGRVASIERGTTSFFGFVLGSGHAEIENVSGWTPMESGQSPSL